MIKQIDPQRKEMQMKALIVVFFAALFISLPIKAGTNDTEKVSTTKGDYRSQKLIGEFSKVANSHLVSMIDVAKGNVKMIVRVAQDRSKVTPAAADTVLDGVEGLCGMLQLGGYEKEMIELLLLQARGKKFPEKPTAIQQRLIKAGNGSIEDMANEAMRCLDEMLKGWTQDLNTEFSRK